MPIELIAMLGGGVSGFVMKLIASQQEKQSRHFEMMLGKQEMADVSASKAAGRGGIWIRRVFVGCVLFAVIIAPFILSLVEGSSVTVQSESSGGLLSFLTGGKEQWESLDGFVILPEVRQAMLAIIGFYFGSSQVK